MAIKVCQLHIYRTASLHLCYQFSDLHLCYYLCKIEYSHAASYMIVKITQNIALQGNMSCSILRSLYSYQLHHTAYYYMLNHVIAFLVCLVPTFFLLFLKYSYYSYFLNETKIKNVYVSLLQKKTCYTI